MPIAIVALIASLLSFAPNSAHAQDAKAKDDQEVTLTLLHNNDGESKLLPNTQAGYPGVARFTHKLQDLGTSSSSDILLRVTAGDNFLASKEFSASMALPEGEKFYDAVALDGLYEAMALGNHDFDFGPEVAARFISGFTSPFLSANIDTSAEPVLKALSDSGSIAPSTIITDRTSGEKVGVIGAITPRLASISSPGKAKISSDVAAAVNEQVKLLEERDINRIVLISHLQGLDEDRELVPKLKGVDIVVAGGGDELLANPGDTCMAGEQPEAKYPLTLNDADGNEVLVVTAPGGYRCIGQLDVTFDKDGKITEFSGTSHAVELDGPVEQYVLDNVEKPLSEAVAELEAEVIATSDVELDGTKKNIRTGPTNLGELLADALVSAGTDAEVAIQNGGGIRNDSVIPAGDITTADTFDIAPFSNFVVTGEIERDDFKKVLEVAVAGLPNAEGTYPQISGFNMRIDTSKPANSVDPENGCATGSESGQRVRDVILDDGTTIISDGKVVAGGPIRLATIDFLASGGDCYPLGDIDFTPSNVTYQQALADHLVKNLNGTVSSDVYPQGGSRVSSGAPGDGPGQDTEADKAKAKAEADKKEAEAKAEAAKKEAEAKAKAEEDKSGGTGGGDSDKPLPNTGSESALFAIIALTTAAAGTMLYRHSRRVGELSVGNRLSATRAWFPEKD